MKTKTSRGFTIVELIIVIAVIGVLAAILIPTFANVINKAHVKSDISNLRTVNTMIASYNAEHGTIDGGEVLYEIAEEAGYDKKMFTPKANGHTICFDPDTQQLVYVEVATGSVVFPSNIVSLNGLTTPLVSRESMTASDNFHPVYVLNDNLQFTGNLEMSNASGINLRGYVLHCESLTINTVGNDAFVIKNGSIEVEGEFVVNGHHVTHSNDVMISCSSANLNVSDTTYELRGSLNVTGDLALNGSTRLLKHKGAALQYGNAIQTGSATMVNEDNSPVTSSDVVKYTVGGTEYGTLELAYNNANAGDTIHVSAGKGILATGTLNINKSINIQGVGKFLTQLTFADTKTQTKFFRVKADNMTFSNMSFVGKVQFVLATPSTATVPGFSSSNITFDNIHFDGPYSTGAIAASCHTDPTDSRQRTTNLTITNCSFLRTTNKAMYLECVNGMKIENCWFRTVIQNPDTSSLTIVNNQLGIDINLKGNSAGMLYDAITINKCSFKGFGIDNLWGGAIAIKERGTGTDSGYAANFKAIVKHVTVSNCKFENCQRDIVLGEQPGGVTNASFTDKVSFENCRSNNAEGLRVSDYTISSGAVYIYTSELGGNVTDVHISNAAGSTRYFVVKSGCTLDLLGKTLTFDSGVKLVVEKGASVINGTLNGSIEGAGTWPGK